MFFIINHHFNSYLYLSFLSSLFLSSFFVRLIILNKDYDNGAERVSVIKYVRLTELEMIFDFELFFCNELGISGIV